ncbi:5'/3'-nucleotidase SurE, partial [Candidatus Anaplasma sp. TIGMIC]|uniref:5'/3'-nucleotidase SurE n=1 Tax=Candidatus Anaplasma sp. TIGMIC TaxID=3020713 RepID=UPI00232F10E2
MLGLGAVYLLYDGVVVRVLLTNDDGFHAHGIKVLRDIVSQAFSEVWISAPAGNCSGMSRSITVNSAVTVRCVGDREYTVDGTPVDSVVLGMLTMRNVAGVEPDLVLSGINHGSNVGSRILYSGTIAAAAAAAAVGVPSIAISQEYCASEINWKNSEKVLLGMIESFLSDERWNRQSVMSINIPHADIKGTYFVEQGEYWPHDGVVSEEGKT